MHFRISYFALFMIYIEITATKYYVNKYIVKKYFKLLLQKFQLDLA